MSKLVTLRNISPLGYLNVPLIGREGDAPYLVCHDPDNCHDEHEHDQVVDEHLGQGGSGCLIPGEKFQVEADVAEQLLAQVDNFELVKTPPAKKAAAKKTAAKKAAAKKTAAKKVAAPAAPADHTENPEG